MNKELLKKVAERIVENPTLFDMNTWFDGPYPERPEDREQCGTTACIAGEACLLTGRAILEDGYINPGKTRGARLAADSNWWEDEGRRALGLTEAQANRLFFTDYWPEDFRERYEAARRSSKAAACIAAERIRHMVKTGK